MASSDQIMPHPDVLNGQEYGKFVLTNLAAKRAKQIKEGAPPLVRIESNHPLTIALAEIAAGKIKPLMGEAAKAPIEAPDLVTLEAEDILDVGLLLPALDEEEVAAIGSATLGEEDFEFFEEDQEAEEEPLHAESEGETLASLLGEEEEGAEEHAHAESDADEISLDDLAEEEEPHTDEGEEERE